MSSSRFENLKSFLIIGGGWTGISIALCGLIVLIDYATTPNPSSEPSDKKPTTASVEPSVKQPNIEKAMPEDKHSTSSANSIPFKAVVFDNDISSHQEHKDSKEDKQTQSTSRRQSLDKSSITSNYYSSSITTFSVKRQTTSSSSLPILSDKNSYSSIYPSLSENISTTAPSDERKQFNHSLDNLFESFKCPISGTFMLNPVTTAFGNTYDKGSIEKWFALGNKTDPLTNEELKDFHLTPNYLIKQCVEEVIKLQKLQEKLNDSEVYSSVNNINITKTNITTENKSVQHLPSAPLMEVDIESASAMENIKIFNLLKELNKYAYSKNSFLKHHQAIAKDMLKDLRNAIKCLNRIPEMERDSQYEYITNYIRHKLPSKKGGFYDALISVCNNLEAEYGSKVHEPQLPKSLSLSVGFHRH